MTNPADEAAIAVVRRNTEEVQGKGDWEAFDELSPTTSSTTLHSPAPHRTRPASPCSITRCARRSPIFTPTSSGKSLPAS